MTQNAGTLEFWRGKFGNEYTERNVNLVDNNYVLFSDIFSRDFIQSGINILEFGAGSGQNIKALKRICDVDITSVEINEKACEELRKIEDVNVIHDQINFHGEFDLVLCKGILIHVPPYDLDRVYNVLYRSSKKYILICEYYNPTPLELNYRGNSGKMWKRDFAGEMIDQYPDLELVDYGFVYHRDEYPQDDITWFLLEKK